MTQATDEHLFCARCDYDLATLPEEALCPECGFPVDDSMRVGGTWSVARLRRLRGAALAFVVAAIAWTIFALMLSSFGSPTTLGRLIVAAAVAVHAVALTTAALLATAAGSRQPKRSRVRVMVFLSALAVAAATGVVLLVLRVGQTGLLAPEFVLPAAILLRAVLITAAIGWLMRSLWALSDDGKFSAFIALSLTALSVICWCIYAASFTVTGRRTAVDFGPTTLTIDVLASIVSAAIALTMLPIIAHRIVAR